mmetsp:Transcript_27514/g.75772  ORF Transcript_27514/g.75772 Transcript_27514/m.75772 type:complete len:365 (+) Transcript_27514:124-1218(+)
MGSNGLVSGVNCNTIREPLYRFVYSAESGGYLRSSLVSEGEGGRRFLRGIFSDDNEWFGENEGTTVKPLFSFGSSGRSGSSDAVFNHRETIEGDSDGTVILGRQCVCAVNDDVFCPVGAELCKIRSAYNYDVECQGENQDMFARFMLPFVFFSFIFLGCLLWNSPKGRFAVAYCRKLINRWDDDRYDQEIRRQLDRLEERAVQRRERLLRLRAANPNRVYHSTASSNAQLAILVNGTRTSEVINGQPTLNAVANQRVVLLKTRKYEQASPTPTDEGQDMDEGDLNKKEHCAICLQDFESGDKIGDISCSHVFHSDCLKSWIQRKNYCPLCQQNLARPRSREDEEPQQRERFETDGIEMRTIPID